MSRFEKLVVLCLLAISVNLVGGVISHALGILFATAAFYGLAFPGSWVDPFEHDAEKSKKAAQKPQDTPEETG